MPLQVAAVAAISAIGLVANAVQDGPLGGAGIHESVKEAAEFLQRVFATGDDIIGEMTERIVSSVSATYDTSLFGGSVDVVVSSSLTGDRDAFTMERDIGFRGFLPYRESNADFDARIIREAEKRANDIISDIAADIGIQNYRNTAGDVNA